MAGVDCSTQATKVVVVDARSGQVVRQGRASHPAVTEIAPEAWWDAFQAATTGGLIADVSAVAVGGQQHGMICLDDAGETIRPALLWNDTRSAAAAADLVAELGGPGEWARATGSVPVASFTVTKLRWLAEHEPQAAKRTASVVLPHDWLTWMIGGRRGVPFTDRGDASGTGYWSPATGDYRLDLLERALGHRPDVPRVLGPIETAGRTTEGAVLGPGTGDNMAAALGVGAGIGDVVVSLGTSGTAFTVHHAPSADATGAVAGFADATGRFLPLVCTLNAARVLDAVATLLGTDHDGLSTLAMAAAPGADGLVLLPYLEGERTPNRPRATGLLAGLRGANASPENLARAAVEGMLCGLADALDALRRTGVQVHRILLIGGAARSPAVQRIAAALFEAPVAIPRPREYVAQGAARQAAWVLAGTPEPPAWPATLTGTVESDPTPDVRAAYAAVRDNQPED